MTATGALSRRKGVIEFVTSTFGGEVFYRKEHLDDSIMHAKVRIGDSMMVVAEATAEFGAMPTLIYLDVTDCDTVYDKAYVSLPIGVVI